jgi:hypothetical protein
MPTFDPTLDPLASGWTLDGDTTLEAYAAGPTAADPFTITDRSNGYHLGFYAPETIADGYELNPTIWIDTTQLTRIIELDSGVLAGFTNGARQCVATLVQLPGAIRKISILMDQALSPGIPVDWSVPVTFKLKLNGANLELTANGQTESIPLGQLPVSNRATATVEWGCFKDSAICVGKFRTLGQVAPPPPATVHPLGLNIDRVRVRDAVPKDRLRIHGIFSLEAGRSIGIAAGGASVSVTSPDGATPFYGQGLMPVQMEFIEPDWVITAAEKLRTGIEQLLLHARPDGRFGLRFVDGRMQFAPGLDFSRIQIALALGDPAQGDTDGGTATVKLTNDPAGSPRWVLG